ncbi:MAG TPA: glycosyl hydrolase family 17 [Balneola sp.]|jgi:exo-beta-1,3-glucanase (GH17 family)|nr:glycosyl hydrolase family 17 [Balneola sp.]MAO78995.1 glycosyl hydrolase family 17 [Balneola sp.]MBF63654.1 glycosyl hydrolase family 17 [Balneola sp.]HBZ40030.1 glycosyl hydrolase family 17 [Balneola sp.]|tara:strand:- start:7080 stop:8363 length:1284 start_codon:yes stop_codon:yes gene_type:complete
MTKLLTVITLLASLLLMACGNRTDKKMSSKNISAKEILGNPEYQAISYSGYRELSRDVVPTIVELKEDMLLLEAMGIKIIRTYNVYLEAVPRLLEAISELKKEDPEFEMYVMMGAWIDAKNAWTEKPDRIRDEDSPRNSKEIERAANLANKYPDIVKIIAVGNEAMVHWQEEYWVEPGIILHWVKHLQDLKKEGKLPKDLWITSSDNFASWGGGGEEYHKEDLNELIRSIDYISMHTYPMHDTHYNPDFWGVRDNELNLSDEEKIEAAMQRSLNYATSQYQSVIDYMKSIGVNKPVHIGETGWATVSNGFYGNNGSKATDEFKMGRYHDLIRSWTDENKVSVFYFEAFDEKWKDAQNQLGSENHFGLITLQSEAKYPLWEMVDAGVFEGLTRDGKPITKTFGGNVEELMKTVKVPPTNAEIQAKKNQ